MGNCLLKSAGLILLCCLFNNAYAQKSKATVYFLEDEYCGASYITCISPNARYVVGHSDDLYHTAFIWDRETQKATQITGSDENLALAYGVTDEGVVAGMFQDSETKASDGTNCPIPGIWKEGKWTALPRGEGSPLSGSWLDGFALSISADGKTISGTLQRTYGRYSPAQWIDGVLQEFNFEDVGSGQGAYCLAASGDGKTLGGWAEHENGSRSPSIWIENKIKRLIGETEDETYFFEGQVRGISKNGKYAVGYFSLNGTGSDIYPFIWSEENGAVKYTDSGSAGAVSNTGSVYGASGYMGNGTIYKDGIVTDLALYLEENYDFDSKDLKYSLGTVTAISDDEKVIGGWTIGGSMGGMPLMTPYIVVIEDPISISNSNVESELAVQLSSNCLSIEGEFNSASIYNSVGTEVLSNINLNTTDISGLKEGVYFVKVTNNLHNKTFKIIKR